MVVIALGVESTVHIQVHPVPEPALLKEPHGLHQRLPALVPDQGPHEAKAHLARGVCGLLQRLHMVRAHAVVGEQEGVRVKAALCEVHLPEEAAGADPEVRGSVGRGHKPFAVAQIGVLRGPPLGELRGDPELLDGPREDGQDLPRAQRPVHLVSPLHMREAALFDAEEAAAPHVARADRAVRPDHLDPRAQAPVVVAGHHRREASPAGDLHELRREVNEVLEVHEVGLDPIEHLPEGRLRPLLDVALLEARVVQPVRHPEDPEALELVLPEAEFGLVPRGWRPCQDRHVMPAAPHLLREVEGVDLRPRPGVRREAVHDVEQPELAVRAHPRAGPTPGGEPPVV